MSTVDDFTIPWTIARKPAPWMRAGPQGKEAEITFQIGLNDLPSFVATLIGNVETIIYSGGTIDRVVPLQHPDDPELLAIGYHAEAFGTPGGTGASIHTAQFSHYRVRVDFTSLPFNSAGDTAYYTLTNQSAEQFETIPGVTLHFSNGDEVTGDFGLPTPITVVTLTTFLSPTPISYATRALLGRINSVAFDTDSDDIPQYMLRFTNVNSDYQKSSASQSLVKSYGFQFRDPHWNSGLRKDGEWDTFTVGSTGVGRFLTTDLNALKYL